MTEKRRHLRLAWRSKLKIFRTSIPRQLISEGLVRNISQKGFSFFSESEIKIGFPYAFEIDMLGFPVKSEGKVMRADKRGSYTMYAVRFESMGLFDRIRLNQFLSGMDPRLKLRYLITAAVVSGVLVGGFFLLGVSKAVAIILFFALALLLFGFPPF
jgi:hypothetical protein